MGRGDRRHIQRQQRRPRQCRDFTRHAIHAQAMRQVGRELEGEQGVIQIEALADILANRRVRVQLQQTAVVIVQLQFFGRAQHALAFHAAQLAQLDQKRFAIFTRRQLGADQRARHFDADTRIGRTADDIEQSASAYIDLANP